MYHSISEGHCKGVHPYFALETSPLIFKSHVKYLQERGYKTISVADVVEVLRSEQADGQKYVVLTFDDGYRDFYTHAYPIMSKYGCNATVYLPTDFIRQHPNALFGKECLSWAEVRELHRSGVIFGSHGINHSRLEDLSYPNLEREICESKESIENEIGAQICSFAYPFAFPLNRTDFAHRLRDLLKAAGYHDGVSKIIGTVHSLEDRFFFRRIPANSVDDIALFEAKLEGDYDWLRIAQSVSRSLRWNRSSGFIHRKSINDFARPL